MLSTGLHFASESTDLVLASMKVEEDRKAAGGLN